MIDVLEVLTLVCVAVAMVPALAHALEHPGKMRLGRDGYLTVQSIYYPGFTFVGVAEPLAILAAIALLFFMPAGSMPFWLTLASLGGLACMHAVFWLVTQPVNHQWIRMQPRGREPAGMSSKFLSTGGGRPESDLPEWTALRDRWERSHLARAGLTFFSFVALAVAISIDPA